MERGAEFILPGYGSMTALAARFGIPLVLKGTPYGRRVPIGEEAASQSALETAFDRIAVEKVMTSPPPALQRLTLPLLARFAYG